MQPYRNLGGEAGVCAYELGPGSITVQFNDGAAYLYTDRSAGASSILRMQQLATAGRGLTTYINRYVRKGYARKLR